MSDDIVARLADLRVAVTAAIAEIERLRVENEVLRFAAIRRGEVLTAEQVEACAAFAETFARVAVANHAPPPAADNKTAVQWCPHGFIVGTCMYCRAAPWE